MHAGRSRKHVKLFSTKTDDASSAASPIPMSLLAGFLGSGKTTTLSNLLNNNQGLKIGIIVNDVASINIDNKLLANPNIRAEETIELQNGCACCSLADELFSSVEKITDNGKRDLDAIVVELSGVADPNQIRANWLQAITLNAPATKLVRMDKIVTLVDSSTFGTDWMTWEKSGDREGWVDPLDECGGQRKVPELLAEQVEAADILVINKIDLAGEEQVKVASALAKSLNKDAKVFEVEFGDVGVKNILQTGEDEKSKEEDDHNICNDPGCSDNSHHHQHDHGHHHDHHHDDHEHAHTHDHAHDHHHSTSTDNLGITNFVYKSDRPFNPMRLLSILNQWPVPIKNELDLGQFAAAAENGYNVNGQEEKSAFVGVLRSKGFCWMAPTRWVGAHDDVWRHDTAMYWSHAGKHFGISNAGKWWGTMAPEQMKAFFSTNQKEYERILKEDFVSDEFGDRRQELVFIGANLDEEEITNALDDCLCTDEEMVTYRQQLRNFIETTFTVEADSGPSLFDVGATEHIDMDTDDSKMH